MKSRQQFIGPVAIAVALLASTAGCAKTAPASSHAAADAKVDSNDGPLELVDLDDRPFDPWQQDSSSITVVVFTRSDCPISNRFAPEIFRLYETYHPRGVGFYLVYVDPHELPAQIREHVKEYGYPCPALRDPRHKLVKACGAKATPEAVVFDRQRTIVYAGRVNDLYVELGNPRAEPTTNDLADAIEATLAGRPVATPRTKAIGCPIADLAE